MATIKSFTNLEQSKKLAKILPLESADMFYMLIDQGLYLEVKQGLEPSKDDIPCWSLAALLNILPDELEDNHFLTLDKEGNEYCCCYEDANGNSFRHTFADNPIDACVEMIMCLHELNLLRL